MIFPVVGFENVGKLQIRSSARREEAGGDLDPPLRAEVNNTATRSPAPMPA
jgi:hypothetical protein